MLLQLLDGRTDDIRSAGYSIRGASGNFTLRKTVTHVFKVHRHAFTLTLTRSRAGSYCYIRTVVLCVVLDHASPTTHPLPCRQSWLAMVAVRAEGRASVATAPRWPGAPASKR